MVGREHATRPLGQLLDQLDLGAESEHRVGAEPTGEVGLGVEPGHDGDLDVGVQRPEDGDRARAERASPPDQRLAAAVVADDG